MGPWLRGYWSGRELVRQCGALRRGRRRGPLAVVPYYGNETLLSAFLDHHRRLGIAEFVFLDLSAAGKLAALLRAESDCAVWRPRRESVPQRTISWLNHLRWRYASGRWCLSLDPSELFVFHRCETRQIADLTDFLEAERRDHIYALVVDMYGDEAAANLRLEKGAHPLDALPYFDGQGYVANGPHRYRNVIVRGGVRRRTLYCDNPRQSPVLNRIPLVKWRWYYVYIAGTRLLVPFRLNTSHSPWHSSPTASLLSLALLDSDERLVLGWLAEGGAIAAGGSRPPSPGLIELRRRRLREDISERFTGSAALVDCGLINPGQWF
jgi:Glycosyl transferase family 2